MRIIGIPKLKLSLPLLPAKFTATSLPLSSMIGAPLDPGIAGMLYNILLPSGFCVIVPLVNCALMPLFVFANSTP